MLLKATYMSLFLQEGGEISQSCRILQEQSAKTVHDVEDASVATPARYSLRQEGRPEQGGGAGAGHSVPGGGERGGGRRWGRGEAVHHAVQQLQSTSYL